jgi:hypothetical protein
MNPYREDEPRSISDIESLLETKIFRIGSSKKKKGIHSELHKIVSLLRYEFGETATTGKGSFGFYLRLLKDVPISTMYIWLGSIKDSPRLDTPLAKAKIFWWKYKTWKTEQKPKI